MKIIFTRYSILFSFFLLISNFSISAQDITGIWRGYFITEGFERYKFELQVRQTGGSISGVSYSYLSTVFYGKATLTGIFSKGQQSAMIKEIKTVELKMSGGSQACIMKCIFDYEKSGNEEFLEGTFTSAFEKNSFMNKRGDNCGSGKVYLRKVTSSDFYIEPFLRGKVKTAPVIINQAPVKKVPEKTVPPVVKNSETKNNPPVVPKPDPVVNEPKKDSIIKAPVNKPNPIPDIPKPAVLKDRSNELVKVITVYDPEVSIKIYDNGEIDDDTISVYYDNKLLLSNKRLSASPIILKLKIEDDQQDHELILVAENLGRIPPNTSLMIVEAGGQRFDVRITSTEQKNAVVRFKYQKPK